MKEGRKTYFSGHIENGVLWQFWPMRCEFVFTDPEIEEADQDIIGKYNIGLGTFKIGLAYSDKIDDPWTGVKERERMNVNVRNCRGFCDFLNELIKTATTE